MTQDVKKTISEDSLNIALSLEKIRDSFHKNVQDGLYYETVSLYLVNFCVRYPILLHELIEKEAEERGPEVVYKTFIGIQGDSRYLFELFLMTCHFFNQPKGRREISCLSLRLAELLHVHKQDKAIDNLNSSDNTKAKLSSNEVTYRNILVLAEKYGIKDLPRNINDCYKKPLEEAGFIHYQNAKIDYRNEWENNTEVKLSLNSVNKDFEKIAQPLYALFSLYEHPSYASIEKLNGFIKLAPKERLEKIENEKFQILSMIKLVAKAMEFSCRKNLTNV